jgi:TetR/AcrR family transcriptional regulator
MRRQQERSAETRRAILAAASRIFAEAGPAGARTEAIAEEAGVNKAMLYYYFKSKESLFQAVIEDHFHEFNEQALEVLTSPGSARAVLLKYAGMHFDFVSKRIRYAPLYQHLMMSGGKPLGHLVEKYFVPRSKAMHKLLERGMREGEFRKAGVLDSSISVVALVVFYFTAAPVLRQMGHPDPCNKANLKRRRQEVLDFIRHGLFANPEAPLP